MCLFVIVCVYAYTKPHELLLHLCLILRSSENVVFCARHAYAHKYVRTRTHAYACIRTCIFHIRGVHVFCVLAAILNQLWIRPPCYYKKLFSYRTGSGHFRPNHGFFIGCCFLWSDNHPKPVVNLITLLLQNAFFLTDLDQGISNPTMASSLGDVFCDLANIPNLLWIWSFRYYKMYFSCRSGSRLFRPHHGLHICMWNVYLWYWNILDVL